MNRPLPSRFGVGSFAGSAVSASRAGADGSGADSAAGSGAGADSRAWTSLNAAATASRVVSTPSGILDLPQSSVRFDHRLLRGPILLPLAVPPLTLVVAARVVASVACSRLPHVLLPLAVGADVDPVRRDGTVHVQVSDDGNVLRVFRDFLEIPRVNETVRVRPGVPGTVVEEAAAHCFGSPL